ncbi:16S rRNA processing protein RimM [hydrothermal vent metagenome]|uniref:16S rRNA processing protein RimM n=1 Tax=hydrothermal vent metagenome TaxID=652676 RepID=A0A1W1D1U6_9ZZZZ
MKKQKEPLLHIATLGKTVGIKGDMKFYDKSDFPEQFQEGSTFLTNLNQKITLEEVDLERGIVRLQGVHTLEDAKRYTNAKLLTTREETRKNCHLEEGEHFWFDLEDCDVYEDGKLLGVVYEVERIALTNYLHIITDKKLVEDGYAKRFLLPYEKPFVLDTDIEKKIITVSGAMDILEAS